jgi:predicted nucleic acid-binding protein
VIYLDTSAMVKLVVREAESAALLDWLGARPDEPLVTSVVGRIELIRAAGRVSASVKTRARAFLVGVDTSLLTSTVAELAETIGEPSLRTLDALHLASAYLLQPDLLALCAYDLRLTAAADSLGLPIASPGR